jgi:ribonuclease G
LKTEILISVDDWENRVAVLEEGSLAEIYFEREEKVIGSIYKGRVENVLPGMGACFVNIGLGRNAFLYVDDILRDPINIGETEITDRRKGHTVSELLKVGSDVLVQIVKEPRGLKGARVSTNISLPGRYLVLMPTGRYSGVSSRIEDADERARLKQIMRRVRPEGMATIVRTAAAGVSEAELIADLGVQLRLWHGILESYKRASAPALLHKDLNLVFKAVRDFLTSDVTAVYIDSKEQYEEIRSTMSLLGPQYINRLKLVDGPGTLFEQRGIDAELEKLLKPKIPLPSGGHLVLEHTEALTVIDVNTGKFTGGRNLEDTIVRTNVEAAAEIARQVRLRDIGGIIVVDFIDMAHERSREAVISTLTEALRRDRTRSTIQVFSKLGLLEFTRKRVGKDLEGQLHSECPTCGGLGTVTSSETVAIGVLRKIRNRFEHNGATRKLDVVADAGVATQLLGWYSDEFRKLASDHDADIAVFVDTQRPRDQVVVEDSRRMRAAPLPGSVVEAELLPVRLPNPASGVAEHNGYLIEVKDAANAAGQLVKVKIEGVEGSLVKASLAEPLAGAARRRRRERGRAKEVAAAPIAPPTPMPAPAEAVGNGLRHIGERQAPARHRFSDIAFSIEDEGESTGPRVTVQHARPHAKTRDKRRGDGRKRPGARRSEADQQPLVVGGEGEIDYDDGDEPAVASTQREAGATRGRRRRRRGSKSAGERPAAAVVRGQADEAEAQDGLGSASFDENYGPQESDDELDIVIEPRRAASPQRQYGPIRQLYGRPVKFEERAVRDKARPDERALRGSRVQSAPAAPKRRRQDDDLDIVIKPKGPAKIRVDARTAPMPARNVRRDEHEGRGHPPRARDERRAPGRRERADERRGGRAEGRVPQRPKREGPAVRQLYPPPGFDAEEAMPEQSAAKPPPLRGRQPHGPLMRSAGEAPVQKGKVRQLYPPPDQSGDLQERAGGADERPPGMTAAGDDLEYDRIAYDEAGDEAESSVFVSDAEELEDRRRRARERAEARRRAQESATDANEGEPSAGAPFGVPQNESDEWPIF